MKTHEATQHLCKWAVGALNLGNLTMDIGAVQYEKLY